MAVDGLRAAVPADTSGWKMPSSSLGAERAPQAHAVLPPWGWPSLGLCAFLGPRAETRIGPRDGRHRRKAPEQTQSSVQKIRQVFTM